MSKRPHTKYDKTDKEIEELVNNQLNPTPDYKQEIEGILGTVYKRVAGKDYTTGNGGLSNIYYEDCTYKLTQALTHLIETEKKKELQSLLDDETKGATCICQQADVGICDHNWSLCNEIRDRIKELKGSIDNE